MLPSATHATNEAVVEKIRTFGIKAFELDPSFLVNMQTAIPAEGWPEFSGANMTVKAAAPTPALKLELAQWKQWRSDLLSFKFDKLRNRKVMYAYYLSSPKAKKVDEILDAIKHIALFEGNIDHASGWMAIGVDYKVENENFPAELDLYRKVAVPVEWSKSTYQFINAQHDSGDFFGIGFSDDYGSATSRLRQLFGSGRLGWKCETARLTDGNVRHKWDCRWTRDTLHSTSRRKGQWCGTNGYPLLHLSRWIGTLISMEWSQKRY